MYRSVTLLVIAVLLAGCSRAGHLKAENERLKVEAGSREQLLDAERGRAATLECSIDTARSIQLILACAVVILGCTLAGVLAARKGVDDGIRHE